MTSKWLATIVFGAIAVTLVAWGTPAAAQHHGGMHGGGMQGMRGGAGHDMSSMGDQTLRGIDAKLSQSETIIRELAAKQSGGASDAVVGSMRETLDRMRQVHGAVQALSKDPMFMQQGNSMKSFDQLSRNFDKMAGDFQEMAKNLSDLAKTSGHQMKH